MTDSRLVTINQMILAVLFGVGLLGFMFALVFAPQKLDQVTTTIVSNLLSVLGTVVVMQNTHFFKSSQPDMTAGSTPLTPVTGDTPHVGTQINAQTVYHGGVPPINPVA